LRSSISARDSSLQSWWRPHPASLCSSGASVWLRAARHVKLASARPADLSAAGRREERTPAQCRPGSVTPASLTFVDCFARSVLFGDHQAATVNAVGFIHSTAWLPAGQLDADCSRLSDDCNYDRRPVGRLATPSPPLPIASRAYRPPPSRPARLQD